MKDREVIHAVLSRVARRISFNRALREIVFAAGVVLFAQVAFQLARPTTGLGGMSLMAGLGLGLASFAIYAVWRASRRVPLTQAAGEVDARAQLRDELKSACWFLSNAEQTPFVQAQVARAARTAQGVDPVALVPARAPRSLAVLTALAILLAATAWVMPRLSHSWEILARADTAVEMQDAGGLRARLQQLPAGAEVQQIEQALAVFERPAATAEELEQAAREVRDAAERANMRAAVAREALDRLAGAMQGRAELEHVARALEQGRVQEAMALLREAHGDPLRDAGGGTRSPAAQENLQKALEHATRELGDDGTDLDRETLQRALRVMQDSDQTLQMRREVTEIAREMQEFHAWSALRSPYSSGDPDQSSPPESGNIELRSGGTSQQGVRLRLDDDGSQQDGSGVGAGAGDTPTRELMGAPTARLDVELQLEAVQVQSTGGGDAGDESWFLAPTREQAATAEFAAVREGRSYTRAEIMGPPSIPLRQRQLVKDYFINLHESQDQ
ncbi:MAG TPA: hypothetical protein VMP00_05030 [Burkholderiales bacterium]|nr:hypothetical protein [Burkholderiales bacterium]